MGVPYEAVEWRSDHGATDDDTVDGAVAKQMAVSTLINQYRVRGHLIANTEPVGRQHLQDPLRTRPRHVRSDDLGPRPRVPDRHHRWHLCRGRWPGPADEAWRHPRCPARRLLAHDRRRVHAHRQTPRRSAGSRNRWRDEYHSFDRDSQHHILERLSAAEAIEKFLATRYVGQKRFGIEGGESAIPTLDAILSAAADGMLDRAVIGMAHRGRLNVLVNILGKRYRDLFSEFEGAVDETDIQGSGDVKYHLGFEGKHTSLEATSSTSSWRPTLTPRSGGSGRRRHGRAYMDQSDTGNYPVLPVLLHGDAAFAGQGVVSRDAQPVADQGLQGRWHDPSDHQQPTRLHDRPPPVALVGVLDRRRQGGAGPDLPRERRRPGSLRAGGQAGLRLPPASSTKTSSIDMIGYRRHGHNEGDDPSYTQPLMYRKIADRAVGSHDLHPDADRPGGHHASKRPSGALDYFQAVLQKALDETRDHAPPAGLRAKPAPPPQGVLPHIDDRC